MPASAATRNETLSNYASGLSQDVMSALAQFIAPVVPTGIAHGQYKKYDSGQQFKIYDTARAVGGPRNRIEFAASDPYFNCTPQGLEITIDDHERALAGEAGASIHQEAKISNLVASCHTGHEKKVWDLVKAGKAATGGIGVWSNSSNDPVSDIDGEIEAISNAIGRMPNKIVFGLGAWRVFRNHALVRSRIAGLVGALSMDAAAGLLLNPAMQLRVGVMPYDTVKTGGTKNTANIVGSEVFIFYGEDRPSLYDPSFAKTFSVSPTMIEAVREYREERNASDVYYVDWSEDIEVISADSARRITVS